MIIFGKNIPLVEALFISLLLIICVLISNVVYLILMMRDLKKLKDSLRTESTDIIRLESDIGKWEADKVKPQDRQAIMRSYITDAYMRGFNKAQIQGALIKKGWPRQQVANTINPVIDNLKKIYVTKTENQKTKQEVISQPGNIKQETKTSKENTMISINNALAKLNLLKKSK